MKKITAVAFDVDGTLYSEPLLYMRALSFGVHNRRIIAPFRTIRRELHQRDEEMRDIRDWQIREYARITAVPLDVAHDQINRVIYTEWRERVCRMPLIKGVRELLKMLRMHNIPMAILSDFPSLAKLQRWDIAQYFEVIVNSESTHALKPHHTPFRLLAERLGHPPESILYVGNSISYDILPAYTYGYHVGYYYDPLLRLFRARKNAHATHRIEDKSALIFSHYQQLFSYIVDAT